MLSKLASDGQQLAVEVVESVVIIIPDELHLVQLLHQPLHVDGRLVVHTVQVVPDLFQCLVDHHFFLNITSQQGVDQVRHLLLVGEGLVGPDNRVVVVSEPVKVSVVATKLGYGLLHLNVESSVSHCLGNRLSNILVGAGRCGSLGAGLGGLLQPAQQLRHLSL